MILRRARFNDLQHIQQLNIQNSTENFLLATFLSTLSSCSASFVAELDGSIVGYVETVVDVGERVAHIHSICVDGRYRRNGIGRMLVDATVRCARIQLGPGGSSVDLYVRRSNHGAVSLYSSVGFRATSSGPYYECDEPGYKMSMDL